MNLSAERLLPPRRLALLGRVAALAAGLDLPIYLVGGFARDALLGRPVNDFDLVVEGNAVRLGRALQKDLGGKLTVHSKFHTATWFLPTGPVQKPAGDSPDRQKQPGDKPPPEKPPAEKPAADKPDPKWPPPERPSAGTPGKDFLDLISARSETYEHPAALPIVQLGTLEDDLRRRDFTINAMAVRLEPGGLGELADPLGGQADLERGLVRVLYPRSFLDDPTRLFRAVRYAERYGFQIEPTTADLIPAAAPYVEELSPERLRHELDLIFEEEDSVPMLEKAWELGLLSHVRPALPWDEAVRERFHRTRSHCCMPPRPVPPDVEQHRDWRWMVWLMGLGEAEIHALAKRLHFTANLSRKIEAAASIYQDQEFFTDISPSACVKRLMDLPHDSVMIVLFSLPPGEPHDMLASYLTRWKNVHPFTTGDLLVSLGMKPGPLVGKALWELRAAWLDGKVASEEQEYALLDGMIH